MVCTLRHSDFNNTFFFSLKEVNSKIDERKSKYLRSFKICMTSNDLYFLLISPRY